MNGTPMRLVIMVLAGFGAIALFGAVLLKVLGETIPNELWMIVSNAATAIGALLANPRSGVETRATETSIPIEAVDSIELSTKKK